MDLHPKFKKPIKTYWDSFCGSYQMGHQRHRVFLLDLLKSKGVKSILDNGCGTGPICKMIQDREDWIFDYKGTDYSFAMVESAKEISPESNFEIQDARELKEADNSWDCVLLLHALDHVDNYAQVIKEAVRVASKYVCIVLWRPFVLEGTNLNDNNTMNKEPGEKPWEDSYLHEYSREVLVKEFEKNNLAIEFETGGEEVNEGNGTNYLFLLKKNE